MRIIIVITAALALASCATQKETRTLAQICAEEFPVKSDTVVQENWRVVNFPVPELDTLFVDSIPCPPGLADTVYVPIRKEIRIPGKTVRVEIPVSDTTIYRIDQALEQAYKDLQEQYRKAITDLEVCQARYTEAKEKKPNKLWLWALILGIVAVVVIVLKGRQLPRTR